MKFFYYILGLVLSIFISYCLFLNHVDYNEIGISYNSWTGEIKKQEVGWHITSPLVRVTYVPTIPIRVEFDMYSRFVLPKLVKFNPEYYKEFIQIEGFHYIQDCHYLFKQYAYSDKKWVFLDEVKSEVK